MTLCAVLYYFLYSRSTCFGRNPRPSSGANKLYSQHLGLTNGVCPAVVVDKSERRRLDTHPLLTQMLLIQFN
jgi:hypothetical protein